MVHKCLLLTTQRHYGQDYFLFLTPDTALCLRECFVSLKPVSFPSYKMKVIPTVKTVPVWISLVSFGQSQTPAEGNTDSQSKLSTVHSSEYIVKSSQFRVHSSQYTVHSTQFTEHSSEYTYHIPYFIPHSTEYKSFSEQSMLQSTFYILQLTVYSSQSIVNSQQLTVHSHSLQFTVQEKI